MSTLVNVLVDEASEDPHAKQNEAVIREILDESNGNIAVTRRRPDDATAINTNNNPAELEKLKADISAKLQDPNKRQRFMGMLVENGKARISKAEKISERIGNVAGTILSIKPVVDIVLQIPQAAPAALPWAGICVGLEVGMVYPFSALNIDLCSLRFCQILLRQHNHSVRELLMWLLGCAGIAL